LLQRNSDTPILLTKNQIKAIKSLVFKVVRKTFNIEKIPTQFECYGVSLESVLVWAIREHNIFKDDFQPQSESELEFNIKIDGRPLGG